MPHKQAPDEIPGAQLPALPPAPERDGAEELKRLRNNGATTFAQDKDSSVVHGMPGEAIRPDAASFALPPEKIAAALISLANAGKKEFTK